MRSLIIGVGRRGGDCLVPLTFERDDHSRVLYADTDADDLERRPPEQRLRLGAAIPLGDFRRNDPSFSCAATLDERAAIEEALEDREILVLVAGLGGGTGAGASQALASIARERGRRVIALVTRPFAVEGEGRVQRARRGFKALAELTDLVVPVFQDQLLPQADRRVRLRELVSIADQLLRSAVLGLMDQLRQASSWADLEGVLGAETTGLVGVGVSEDPAGVEEAARFALTSPLLRDLPLDQTRGLLLSLRSRAPLPPGAGERAGQVLRRESAERAELRLVERQVPELENALQLSVVVLGAFGEPRPRLEGFFVPGPTG